MEGNLTETEGWVDSSPGICVMKDEPPAMIKVPPVMEQAPLKSIPTSGPSEGPWAMTVPPLMEISPLLSRASPRMASTDKKPPFMAKRLPSFCSLGPFREALIPSSVETTVTRPPEIRIRPLSMPSYAAVISSVPPDSVTQLSALRASSAEATEKIPPEISIWKSEWSASSAASIRKLPPEMVTCSLPLMALADKLSGRF